MLILKPLLPLLSFSFWGALRPFQELQAIGVSTSTYLLYLAPRWPAVCPVCRLLGDSTVLRVAIQHSAGKAIGVYLRAPFCLPVQLPKGQLSPQAESIQTYNYTIERRTAGHRLWHPNSHIILKLHSLTFIHYYRKDVIMAPIPPQEKQYTTWNR